MTAQAWLQGARAWGQRHEHALIVAWLAGAVALFAVLGLWGVLLGGAEGALRSLDEHWIERVERGEELVRQERWQEAEAYLAKLDREFPARIATHKLDRERERVLTALAATYRAQDRKGRTLDTLRALVEFDALNWQNHALLARACETFGEDGDARRAWERVLELQPANYDALRARVLAEADGGNYAAVVPLYERYLDAFVLAPLPLEVGAATVLLEVPVDGRFHEIDVPLSATAAGSVELSLETAGFSVELDWIELVPARHVGSVQTPAPVRWQPRQRPDAAPQEGAPGEGAAPDRTQGLEPLGEARWAARGPNTRLLEVLTFDGGIARARARLRLFKPLEEELMATVAKSYRNALNPQGLFSARDRSIVGGSAEAIAALAD